MTAKPKDDMAAMSFEDALGELEKIVAQLESGEASLEHSIDLYERGARLRAHCDTKLRDAEMRVEKIIPSGADGKPGVVDFDTTEAKAAKGGAAARDRSDDDLSF